MYIRKIIFVFFIFLSMPLRAALEDYPPTFYQMAQIYHYVQHKKEVDELSRFMGRTHNWDGLRLYPFQGLSNRKNLDTERQEKFNEIFAAVDRDLSDLIPDPQTASDTDWQEAVRRLVAMIINEAKDEHKKGEGVAFYFNKVGGEEVIVEAIKAELNAMKKGVSIMWRASSTSPQAAIASDDVHSFSLGLFSGFIYDNHWSGGACTYTRVLRAFDDYIRKAEVSEGAKLHFYAKLRANIPGYFEEHPELTSSYNLAFDIDDIYKNAAAFYAETCQLSSAFLEGIAKNTEDNDWFEPHLMKGDQQVDRAEAEKTVWGIYYDLHRSFIELNRKRLAERQKHYLYGVIMGPDDIEALRDKAIAASKKWVESKKKDSAARYKDITDEDIHTSFLEPQHALYGCGEVFHPKMPLAPDSEIIEIYNARPATLNPLISAYLEVEEQEDLIDHGDYRLERERAAKAMSEKHLYREVGSLPDENASRGGAREVLG